MSTASWFFQNRGKLKAVQSNIRRGFSLNSDLDRPATKPVCHSKIAQSTWHPCSNSENNDMSSLLQTSMCKFPAVISTSLKPILSPHWEYLDSSVQENVLFVCPWALRQPLRQYLVHTGSPGALQCRSSSLSVCLHMYWKFTVSPLLGLPDPPITLDWAQFRLGVWWQRAPGGLGARSHSWARWSLCDTHVACYPEVPYAAVHPCFQRLTHQLGFPLGLLHGGLLGRQLQYGAQLLEALLQVQVTRRTCMEPAVLFCSRHSELHTKRNLEGKRAFERANQTFQIICHIFNIKSSVTVIINSNNPMQTYCMCIQSLIRVYPSLLELHYCLKIIKKHTHELHCWHVQSFRDRLTLWVFCLLWEYKILQHWRMTWKNIKIW